MREGRRALGLVLSRWCFGLFWGSRSGIGVLYTGGVNCVGVVVGVYVLF